VTVPPKVTVPSRTVPVDDGEDYDLNDIGDSLVRIHWWVRLFGVVWLVGVVIGLCAFAYIAVAASVSKKTECVTYSTC
jgi:hypothetical protein